MDRPIALLGLPFDGNSSYLKGAAAAPAAIREAFRCDRTNTMAEDGQDVALLLHDAGDAAFPEGCDFLAVVDQAVTAQLEPGRAPLLLGGDHSLTYPIVRALARRFPTLTILHFDAHPDLYDEFQGSRLSHACPFARIMEEGLARRLVQVGIRTVNPQQREQARRFGVEMTEMKDWDGGLPRLDGPVYLSFDLDALDPACAPGVSHPEPGGMTTRQALAAIQSIAAPIVAADIVELNPARDPGGITAAVAAKLMKELAARMAAARARGAGL